VECAEEEIAEEEAWPRVLAVPAALRPRHALRSCDTGVGSVLDQYLQLANADA
jgi:hypothetical protein